MNQKADLRLKIRVFLFPLKSRTRYVFARWLKRTLVRKLTLHRPSTYPFISGDAFRSLATHIHDESTTFDPSSVEDGDVVFINTDYLKDFFETKHPHIKKKYILISHNSDACITQDYEKYLGGNLVHWFARNVVTRHEKITPIPIGLMNTAINKAGKTSDLPKLIKATRGTKKQTGISFGFSLLSGHERVELNALLKKHPLGIHILEKNQAIYFEKMNAYSFVASPEGNGPDCHRTWEALYLGCIPIATRNAFIDYFKELAIPILTVNAWSDVEHFDAKFLDTTYEQLKKDLYQPALYMDYWMNRILAERNKVY
jgi:hypothetical protein